MTVVVTTKTQIELSWWFPWAHIPSLIKLNIATACMCVCMSLESMISWSRAVLDHQVHWTQKSRNRVYWFHAQNEKKMFPSSGEMRVGVRKTSTIIRAKTAVYKQLEYGNVQFSVLASIQYISDCEFVK